MLNEGPVAAPFQTAAPNIAAELAMCQRYCEVYSSTNQEPVGNGLQGSTTAATVLVMFKVQKRIVPTLASIATPSNFRIQIYNTSATTSTIAIATASVSGSQISLTFAATGAANEPVFLRGDTAGSLMIFESEL